MGSVRKAGRYMFQRVREDADEKLAEIGLQFNYRLRKTKSESWSTRNAKMVYLNPEDRKSSLMADESELHVLLHECGHIFVAKHKSIKNDPIVLGLFGDMRKPYRRDLSRKEDNPDFISHYAQVHPEDNFAEVFGIYAKNGGNLKAIRTLLRKKRKSRKVLRQFLWLHRFLNGKRWTAYGKNPRF